MLTVLGFTVSHGRAHDHLAFSVKGADLKTCFGLDGFVVVSQGVKTAANGAKDVNGDVNQNIRFRVSRYGRRHAAEQEVIAHQTHEQGGIRLGDGHVLVFAQAFVGETQGFF